MLSRAASATSGGRLPSAPSTLLRYTAVPSVASVAMPSPSPNSLVVCTIEAPEPALSAGTAPMARWLQNAASGPVPSMTTHIAMTIISGPDVESASVKIR